MRSPIESARDRRRAPAASRGRGAEPYVRRTLGSGIPVIAERMPELRSVSIGVWLRQGSRHESDPMSGMSHFIEHMLFKGTKNRTAEQIAKEIDAVGGGLDAFTGKEYACYHAKALDTELPVLVDLLSDLIKNPLFAQQDLDKERKVIEEEIKMAQDAPDDLVHELFVQGLWKAHPLGRPILGTRRSVARFDGRAMRGFWSRIYGPANLLISVAGRFEPGKLFDLLEERFGDHAIGAEPAAESAPEAQPVFVVKPRANLEQVHLCLGGPGIPHGHRTRNAANVLNTILGGSMSSRLFQSIRESRGLAYTVYSFLGSYRDAGYVMVYAACSPENVREVSLLCVKGIAEMTHRRVRADELERAKGHLKGNLMLGLESSGSRMSNLARQEMYFGRQTSLDQMVAEIDRVTADDVRNVARDLFGGKTLSATVLGRVKDLKLHARELAVA
ncbi:MAG: pitrilysin family protein [Acidobacteriota bacterium]